MNEIGKKNIILAGLIVCLVLVSYGNYALFYKEDKSASVTTSKAQAEDINVSNDDPVNATLVSNDVSADDVLTGGVSVTNEFFVEYRLEREKTRSKNLEALQNIAKDSSVSDDVVKKAVDEAVELSKLSEKELIVENLIKSKGYNDAIVLIHEGYANVIVDSDKLDEKDAVKIQDIVSKECDIEINKITIASGNNADVDDIKEPEKQEESKEEDDIKEEKVES